MSPPSAGASPAGQRHQHGEDALTLLTSAKMRYAAGSALSVMNRIICTLRYQGATFEAAMR